MIERHLMKLRARDSVSPQEEEALRSVARDVRTVDADVKLVRAGDELTVSTLLLDGMACRQKDVRSGERQITELHVAGDFVDLHSFTLKRLDHDIVSLTPCQVVAVPHAGLRRITQEFPHLTRLLWFSTNLDASIHREWMLSLGRRSALARTAHLFCELYVRLGIVGLAQGLRYDLRLTQIDLAECLGLTSVHVNRMLRELRERRLVEFRQSTVTILDWDALQRVAEFDPAYLYLEHRPQ
ncbi:MAG: Crp/Fnr family transcriptional regulator [Sphingomonas sp.]|uniref:Crp/Fnr family transcriptional regulator n=1 Tax=Sphingomonas sp. TaxID=28214 RepID=UPI001B1E12CB|nr:Crp/Fnr family transcriptional regulator [Sphingomonas sp.]MBO9624334.1 Crp/Fnr family transcriptional regulator [Sphingomonas sp.]